MTCVKPPLDIQTDGATKCSLKCLLHYKYGDSSCKLFNANVALLIKYDGVSDVVFSNVKYTPTDIYIFAPSLHKYSGQTAQAELLIHHTSEQGGLNICVPITVGTKLTRGSYLLKDIIDASPMRGESATPSIADFNANYLIPASKYFTYTGPMIERSCNSLQYNYVVFHPRYGSIAISAATMTVLQGLITANGRLTASAGTVSVNEIGTTRNGFAGDGQIYIDCQPTGESEEEMVYKEPGPASSIPNDSLMTILLIVIGIALIVGTFLVMKLVLGNVNKITSKSNLAEIKK
jgi:carbonic anhydrase